VYVPLPPVAVALICKLWLTFIVTGADGCAVTSNTLLTVIFPVVEEFAVMPSFAVNVNVQSDVVAEGV
jgi:hypothetical protein